MKLLIIVTLLLASTVFADESAIERWAKAVGGREQVASIKSIYREGTIEYAGMQGTIKVWHTWDGKYRKEEAIGSYLLTETFDGVKGMVRHGSDPAHEMTPEESQLATSRRFANANAMFFAFFPERRHGTVAVDVDGTILLKPEGGIDWRITLDPQTSLPVTMVHQEGNQTITVKLSGYEVVHGVKFETEIHRSAGDPSRGAVIRFTKTVVNGPVDESLWTQ